MKTDIIHKKPEGMSNYNKYRNREDFTNAVHYNHNGKKLCVVICINPKHSTDKTKVTCKYCRHKLFVRGI